MKPWEDQMVLVLRESKKYPANRSKNRRIRANTMYEAFISVSDSSEEGSVVAGASEGPRITLPKQSPTVTNSSFSSSVHAFGFTQRGQASPSLHLEYIFITVPEVFFCGHEENTFLHGHKQLRVIDIRVRPKKPPLPVISPKVIIPIFLCTFINHEHTPMNFIGVCFYTYLLRNYTPFSKKMRPHETRITMVTICWNPLVSKINRSLVWEDHSVLVGNWWTRLEYDVHLIYPR